MTFPFPSFSPVLTTFSVVHTNNGSDTTIEIPAEGSTARVGDLAVIWNWAEGVSNPSSVTPSGFTVLAENTDNFNCRAMISAKRLASADLNAAKSGLSGGSTSAWILAIFRPDVNFASFALGASATGTAGSPNPGSQNIAASGATKKPVLLLAHFGGNSAVDPRTVSPSMTEINGSSTKHYAQYKIYSASEAPQDHSIDMDDEGLNGLQGCWLTFTQ